jgi:hypothetical protein
MSRRPFILRDVSESLGLLRAHPRSVAPYPMSGSEVIGDCPYPSIG